jgi:hypothetical protein
MRAVVGWGVSACGPGLATLSLGRGLHFAPVPDLFVELPWMPAPPRKRYLGAQQRRALQLLAGSPFGATEATMLDAGFERRMLMGLVRVGLAVRRENLKAGSQSVGRFRITDAGRRALEGVSERRPSPRL